VGWVIILHLDNENFPLLGGVGWVIILHLDKYSVHISNITSV